MGYSRQAALPVFRLRFEEYPGLVVRLRPAGLAATILVEEAMPVLRRASVPYSLAELKAIRRLAKALARSLVEWNLKADDGTPVPPTKRAVLDQDALFLLTVAGAWLRAQQPRPRQPEGGDEQARPGQQADDEPTVDEQLLADLPTRVGADPSPPVPDGPDGSEVAPESVMDGDVEEEVTAGA